MIRVALAAGALLVIGFIVLVAIGFHQAVTPLVAFAVLVTLIGGGNLLYGKHSHGAAAKARVRPAQEAQNRAIDEAQQEARRQLQEARRQRREARGQRREARGEDGRRTDHAGRRGDEGSGR